jgi:two-component system sensor kinase FixL
MGQALSSDRPAADGIAGRLAALRAAGLLSAPAEERFDRLTRIARHLLRVPVTLVSLLDTERQFFLSAQGLAEPWAGLRQTPLAYSFCRAVVETGLPMSVADAREDLRVRGNPAIEELGVVAYLAVPLALPDGIVVGALCGIDHKPRAWTTAEEAALHDLAGAVETEMMAGLRLREAEAAGAALGASEERLRLIVESVCDYAIFVTDPQDRIVDWMPGAAAVYGWTAEEAPGRQSAIIFTPEDQEAGVPAQETETARRQGAAPNVRWHMRKDGARVFIEGSTTALRGPDGSIQGFLKIGRDATERRRAEEELQASEARLQHALEAGRLASWELDVATGAVLRAPFHDAIFGYDTPLPVWSYGAFLEHLLPEDRGRVERAYQAAKEGEIGETVECRIRRVDDGAVRWLELHGQAQRDVAGRVVRLHGVLRDVTDRKQVEAALRASESRLRELQAELLHVSRLSAAGEMAATLAHELNQPLTATTSAVQAARRMLNDPAVDATFPSRNELRDAVDLAAEQALRAGRIVRRLRDFVARGETDMRAEDVRQLVDGAGALALAGTGAAGIAFGFRPTPGLPPVLVDRVQIQQVLFNLFRNAVEAMAAEGSGSGTQRELVVTARSADAETVEVAIADTGSGLAPEISGRLFEAFATTKPEGMGMGLAICRTIVEAHGGQLWAEPNPGGGTVFRFTLPVAPLAVVAS